MSFVSWLGSCRARKRLLRAVLSFVLLVRALTPASMIAQVSPAAENQQPVALAAAWSLEETVMAALSRHPLVEAARARVDAARSERALATALPNPVGTIWVENAAFPGQQFSAPVNQETSTYVTWPLEPLLQRSSRTRYADEAVKVAEASLTLDRRHVAAQAVRAFFHVALAQALADEAEENRERLDRIADYNQARVDEGATAEGELLRIRLEVDRAATEVAFADVELTRARAELAPYLTLVRTDAAGLPLLRVDVQSAPAPGRSLMPSLANLTARAREARPELVARRARVGAAAAATDVERTLVVRQMGATIGSKRVEGQSSMIVGVGVAVPLFNRNQGGVARATSERLAAEQELAWTDRTVAADVQSAFESATRLSQQLDDLQQSFLTRAEEMQRLTLGAYEEGGATLLQLLDATRLLADARLTYTRALLAERESLFDLAFAAGGEPADAITLMHSWNTASSTESRTGVAR
jgi:cobalt-zinc-cadmium efflux system outer membrane protein